jgi:DNA-binding MarR family transcriptional regulator
MHSDPSYNYSILLTKAYRTLRTGVYGCLEKYDLIPTQWSLIGIVYRAKTGITLSDAALELGVKLPLVTIMVDYLAKMGIIKRVANKDDGRSKLLIPTKEGLELVERIEADLTNSLAPLMRGITVQQMNTFQTVLQSIINNEVSGKI